MTDSSTSGMKAATISQAVPPGTYWLAVVNQTAAATLRFINGMATHRRSLTQTSQATTGYAVTGVTGALPSTISPTLGVNSNPSLAMLRRA